MGKTDRDYVAEMNGLIGRLLSQDNPDGIVAGVAASSLYKHLQDADPDLLEGWARAIVVPALSQAISRRIGSERATASRRALARAFGEAAKAGDADALAIFRQFHVSSENGVRKAACDMTGREHEYVATHIYEAPANTMLMLAAFHKAVAKKAGDKPVREVMDAAAYARMYQSIVKTPRRIAA